MIRHLGKLDAPPSDEGCFCFEFEHQQSYLELPSPVTLQVLLLNDGADCRCLMTTDSLDEVLQDLSGNHQDQFNQLAERLNRVPVDLNGPIPLEPVYIPKPWGQEIWYSGIEDRGVSTANGIPVAWLFDVFGDTIGCPGTPLLLKILDPLPQENSGDLYFELHEKKVEVYIVTHINRSAWPDGRGRIRYGFSPELMTEYPSRDAFLAAYLDAVKAYEEVRRRIDAGSSGLELEEEELRADMYRFTAMREIGEGDVITVEPFIPHSLQHGVRVVEFQTPHYERYILSFGQKVLTQDHWDTELALKLASIDTDEREKIQSIGPGEDLIADFDAFRVRRITVAPGATKVKASDRYLMIMGISGEITVTSTDASESVSAESAWFLPPGSATFTNSSGEPATILLAEESSPA